MNKLLALAGVCTCVFLAVWSSSCNDSSAEKEKARADSIALVVEKGRYLAHHVTACIHCHSERDFSKFSGPVKPGTEGGGGLRFSSEEASIIPGEMYSSNITPDSATGIGSWTDAEILRAITQGINKKGDTLFPLMPYASFNKMAKEDLLSIIAYLRTLKPISKKVPARRLPFPVSVAYPGPALQASVDQNLRPAETDTIRYGQYLVTMANCVPCHTPFDKGKPDMTRMFAGGNVFTHPGFQVASSNITPDSTGIGKWDEGRFLNKFMIYRDSAQVNVSAGRQNTVMPLTDYAGMKDSDLKAIYYYLRSVKPVNNAVDKYPAEKTKQWNMGAFKVVK